MPRNLPAWPEFRSQELCQSSLPFRHRGPMPIRSRSRQKNLHQRNFVRAVLAPFTSNIKLGKDMKQAFTVFVIAGGLVLTGCHTVNGVGKDVKSAGTAVSNASGESGKKK